MQPSNPMSPNPPQPGPVPQPPAAPNMPPVNPPAPPPVQAPAAPQPSMDIRPAAPSYAQASPPAPVPQSNPISTPSPQPNPYANYAPTPASIPVANANEVVQNIPVRSPSAQPQSPPVMQMPGNPPSSFTPPAPASMPDANDGRMDQILADVNNAVQNPAQQPPPAAKKGLLHPIKAKAKQATNQPKPAMVITLAVVACLSLAAAAFFAFRPGDSSARPLGPAVKLVGTSASASDAIKAGGGTLVTPQDLDDYQKNAESKASGFNDNQEFNSNDLTDKTLGL